jgi:hypothetical protein
MLFGDRPWTAGVDRDSLKDARDGALQYRTKEIKHLQNHVVLAMHNELHCLKNVQTTDGQVLKLKERLEHETQKLKSHSDALAELQARFPLCTASWMLAAHVFAGQWAQPSLVLRGHHMMLAAACPIFCALLGGKVAALQTVPPRSWALLCSRCKWCLSVLMAYAAWMPQA